MFSFIGVSGFFISWATCLAISRHALSRSLCASSAAFSSTLFTILLYSFTSVPISSSYGQLMRSLRCRFICPNCLMIILNVRVIHLVITTVIRLDSRNMKAYRFISVTTIFDIWKFRSRSDENSGTLI